MDSEASFVTSPLWSCCRPVMEPKKGVEEPAIHVRPDPESKAVKRENFGSRQRRPSGTRARTSLKPASLLSESRFRSDRFYVAPTALKAACGFRDGSHH